MVSLNAHTQTGYTELNDVAPKDSFFKNPDLMAMTISHLQVESYEKYRWLLNAALTCKDFLDEALDALWENLDSIVPLLKILSVLQVENEEYFLRGNVSQADWDRLQYYSRKVKSFTFHNNGYPSVHPSTYLQIAQLQSSPLFPSLRHLHYNLGDASKSESHTFLSRFLSPLLGSLEFVNIRGFETTIVGPFLSALSSQMLSQIVLNNGLMSVDLFKKSIVHFNQLRSLELSDAVIMSDFAIWEVLGTLPYLANFTLKAFDPVSLPASPPEDSNSQSGGLKYFDALECLFVKGPFILIQHLLCFIDSQCLKSIEIYPIINRLHDEHGHESEDLLTPSMTIVSSKWSHSLKKLIIGSSLRAPHDAISKCLMLLTVLHEMQTFHLFRWRMENMDDDVRRLVMSWPKLRTLVLLPSDPRFISLSTLRIIAESCPELLHLGIQLDTFTTPPFDIFSRSLGHKLEVLWIGRAHLYVAQTSLESQIRMARHLDLIFPHIRSIEMQHNSATWSGIRDLVRLCQDFRRGSRSMN